MLNSKHYELSHGKSTSGRERMQRCVMELLLLGSEFKQWDAVRLIGMSRLANLIGARYVQFDASGTGHVTEEGKEFLS